MAIMIKRVFLILVVSLSLGFCAEISKIQIFDYNIDDLSLEKKLDEIDVKSLKDDKNKTLTHQEQRQIQEAINKIKKELQ